MYGALCVEGGAKDQPGRILQTVCYSLHVLSKKFLPLILHNHQDQRKNLNHHLTSRTQR